MYLPFICQFNCNTIILLECSIILFSQNNLPPLLFLFIIHFCLVFSSGFFCICLFIFQIKIIIYLCMYKYI